MRQLCMVELHCFYDDCCGFVHSTRLTASPGLMCFNRSLPLLAHSYLRLLTSFTLSLAPCLQLLPSPIVLCLTHSPSYSLHSHSLPLSLSLSLSLLSPTTSHSRVCAIASAAPPTPISNQELQNDVAKRCRTPITGHPRHPPRTHHHESADGAVNPIANTAITPWSEHRGFKLSMARHFIGIVIMNLGEQQCRDEVEEWEGKGLGR